MNLSALTIKKPVLRRRKKEENEKPVRPGRGERRTTSFDLARFFSKTKLCGSCWIWIGAKSRGKGNKAWYGSFWFAGRVVRAHKFAWIEIRGQAFYKGFHLDHTCKNTLCVNPWHLEQVTPTENSLRRWRGVN